MANYGRLGPAGALRYCRSVSIDFEEEPSTQETEQREQHLEELAHSLASSALQFVVFSWLCQYSPLVTRWKISEEC